MLKTLRSWTLFSSTMDLDQAWTLGLCTTSFCMLHWQPFSHFPINTPHLYTRLFDTSIDSLLEIELNNKYIRFNLLRDHLQAWIPVFLTHLEERQTTVGSARHLAVILVLQIQQTDCERYQPHTSLQQVMSLSINIAWPFCASSSSLRRC